MSPIGHRRSVMLCVTDQGSVASTDSLFFFFFFLFLPPMHLLLQLKVVAYDSGPLFSQVGSDPSRREASTLSVQ